MTRSPIIDRKDQSGDIARAALHASFEYKFASGKTGAFSGYGSVFGTLDSHGDVVERGAFSASLSEWKSRGKLPAMLLQHGGFFGSVDDMLPIGKWTSMEEDARGLKVAGQLFALDTDRGRYLHEGMKSGAIDGLSIGYRARKSAPGDGRGGVQRRLLEIDLLELSVVLFPSNDQARIGSAKHNLSQVMSSPGECERFLHAVGLPRKFAHRLINAGFKAAAGAKNDDGRRAELSRALKAATAKIRKEIQ
jgi:HK97 family phage prohead protease